MQKNNFKLKTIFKKGLSFSIALALGAAATSLNTAKIADAAKATVATPDTSRRVYIAGERFSTSGITDADYYGTVAGSTRVAFGTYNVPNSEGTKTIYLASEAGPDNDELAFTYTVVPTSGFTDVADENTITITDGTAFTAARTAILDGLDWTNAISNAQGNSLIAAWGSTATFSIGGADFSSGNISYASHNGKEVSIKLPNGPTFKVGKLAVEKAVSKIELVSEPTNLGFAKGTKFDFSGLKIKVTYSDNTTAEVAYDNTTKSRFSFHKHSDTSSLSTESTMDEANVVVDVVYRGTEVEQAFTFYSCSGNSELKNGQVTVSGSFATGNTLVVNNIPEAEYKTLYEQFQKELGKESPEIIFDKDISLTIPRAYIGSVNVQLYVGEDYAGKFVTVKHLIDANTVETFHCKVLKDGYINFSCNHLSPFMVALGVKDEAAAAEASKKAEEAAKKAEEAAKAKSGSGSAKTGDMSVIAFSVFGFVALISAAVLAYLKKARKSFDK